MEALNNNGMERAQRIRASPQFRGGHFVNTLGTVPVPQAAGMGSLVRRWLGGNEPRVPREPVPTLPIDPLRYATLPASGLRATWIGHSTVLLEIDGCRVLTDPVWGARCSPIPGLGPKRFFAPPLALADLPELDAVVVSHNHYDHLDAPTMRALARRLNGTRTTFVTALGVGAQLQGFGVAAEQIVELDWWESCEVADLQVTAAPARHFSGRGLSDRNQTLWAAWSMASARHRVFFSGDGGMHNEFDAIGRRLGPFDLTLMESGAYNAAWADVHMGPEQAVLAHRQLGDGVFMPVHWGTFSLAFHGWTEPAERVLEACARAHVLAYVPQPGESFEPAALPTQRTWWPELAWHRASEDPIVSSGLPDFALLSAT